MKKNVQQLLVRALLVIGMYLAILENIATISQILNEMLVTGNPLPLQKFLNHASLLWGFIDSFWQIVLTPYVFPIVFKDFAFGGFVFATICWIILKYIERPMEIPQLSSTEQFGRNLSGIYAVLFLLTIIYGINKTKWIPYVQDPRWEINLVHKQQLSAGTFLIIFLIIWANGVLPQLRSYHYTLQLYNKPKYLTYIFAIFMFENFGSFDWFFTGYGYEDIFLNGETLFTFDKVFHFTMSSAFALLVLFYSKEPLKAIITVISLTIFWELFEISLNPLEASDTLLDLFVNTTAILLTTLYFQKFIRTELTNT